MTRRTARRALAALLPLLAVACGEPGASPRRGVVRLATTTGARDSGLLDVLLPAFAAETGIDVRTIAGGTGEALDLGARGDADVVLVDDRAAEDAFVAAGHGVAREDVWWCRFLVAGPEADPGSARAASTAHEALHRVFEARATLVSDGDDSGAHRLEAALWGGAAPAWPSHLEAGGGPAAVLGTADEKNAYALTDDATFLRMRKRLRLVPLLDDDPALRRSHGAVLVRRVPGASGANEPSRRLFEWLAGDRCRDLVRGFAVEGRRVFFLPGEAP